MSKRTTAVPAKAVLHVTVGESVAHNLMRAQSAMEALQRGKPPKSHFGVGFAEVGQMFAVFTPKRWELIARLRETGPLTTAEPARKLDRDYRTCTPMWRRFQSGWPCSATKTGGSRCHGPRSWSK